MNNKIFFSKKGSGYEIGKKPTYYVVIFFFLTISFMLFGFLIISEVSSSSSIPDNARTTVLINRFLNSEDCFAYKDSETGRVYPGIIDIEKFNENNLEKCYYAEKKYDSKSFRLTLNGEDIEKKTILTTNWGSSRFGQASQYVLLYNNGEISKANLLIAVQK